MASKPKMGANKGYTACCVMKTPYVKRYGESLEVVPPSSKTSN